MMAIQRRPAMMETAIFMRSRGYSERSIKEITGLSERELLRWCALERLIGGSKKGGSGSPAILAKAEGSGKLGLNRSGRMPRTRPD